MNKLGILIEDYSGIYLVKQLMNLRPELDYYIIRDIRSLKESKDQYLQKNIRRFQRLELDQMLNLSTTSSHWSQWVEKSLINIEGKVFTWSRHISESGEIPELLIHSLDDGGLERGYSGYILEHYISRIPEDTDYLLLGIAGFGQILPWIEGLTRDRKIEIIDPLSEFIEDLPDLKDEGRQIFYWTERDFPFERRVQEILQRPVEFQMWHDLAWLRRSIEDVN